jgi:hypothetical protein
MMRMIVLLRRPGRSGWGIEQLLRRLMKSSSFSPFCSSNCMMYSSPNTLMFWARRDGTADQQGGEDATGKRMAVPGAVSRLGRRPAPGAIMGLRRGPSTVYSPAPPGRDQALGACNAPTTNLGGSAAPPQVQALQRGAGPSWRSQTLTVKLSEVLAEPAVLLIWTAGQVAGHR